MLKLLQGILLIACILSFLNLLKIITYSSWPDFTVYYNSAKYAFTGHNPYALKGIFVGGYLYPPISLLIFYPLLLFPVIIAGEVWTIFSIICLSISVWLLLKMYNATNNFILICIIGILACNYFPVKFTLGMGQLNMIILLLMTLVLYANQQNKEKLSGILLGISLVIKYHPLLMLPYLLVRQKWKILFSTIFTISTLLILGFLVFQTNTNLYYFHSILMTMTSSVKIDYYNQALSGFLLRDFKQLPTTQIIIIRIILSITMLFITLWAIMRTNFNKKMVSLEISLFIILSLLLNTFSWQHHFVLLLVPLLSTFFMIKQLELTNKYYIWLGVCYILTAINMKNPSNYPVILQSHVFYGAVLLYILDIHLLWQINGNKLNNHMSFK